MSMKIYESFHIKKGQIQKFVINKDIIHNEQSQIASQSKTDER